MTKKIIFLFLFSFCFNSICGLLTAQENANNATATPPVAPAAVPPAVSPPGIAPFYPGPSQNIDPRILTEMREDLTMNLRNITQMLGQIDPQDIQYSDSLKREQNLIIEQLKQLDTQIKAATAQQTTAQQPQPGTTLSPPGLPPAGLPGAGLPGLGGNYGDQPPALPANWQEMSPEELAQYFAAHQQPRPVGTVPPLMQAPLPQPQMSQPPLVNSNDESQRMLDIVQKLRENGLNDLAEQTLASWQREMQARGLPSTGPPSSAALPSMTLPTTTPSSITSPLPTPGGFAPAGPNLWQPQSPQEIAELKETVSKLHLQIEQLQRDIKAMETQLQLLNRNILLNQQPPQPL